MHNALNGQTDRLEPSNPPSGLLTLPASGFAKRSERVHAPGRSTNMLLESLTEEESALVLASTEAVPLPLGVSLYRQGVRPQYAYFLTDGIASITSNMKNGRVAEVGIVGREGLVGAECLLGRLPIANECYIQISGSGRRIAFNTLERLLLESASLRARVLENVQHSLFTARQLSACNALHSVSQRLAHWLLIIQDRMQADEFNLTHEFLAVMISAHRPTISIVAANLQRDGIIAYRHGHVRILQRERLENASCDCYPIMNDLLHQLYK